MFYDDAANMSVILPNLAYSMTVQADRYLTPVTGVTSLFFDGNAYVISSGQTTSQLVINGDFSVCAWVRLTSDRNHTVFDIGNYDTGIRLRPGTDANSL